MSVPNGLTSNRIRVGDKVSDWLRFLQDIEDTDKNDQQLDLTTDLTWMLDNGNDNIKGAQSELNPMADTNAYQRILKKYLLESSADNLHYTINGVAEHLVSSNEKYLRIDATEALSIGIKDAHLQKREIIEKGILCKESRDFFIEIFWFFFISYFINEEHNQKFKKPMSRQLSITWLSLLLANEIQLFENYPYTHSMSSINEEKISEKLHSTSNNSTTTAKVEQKSFKKSKNKIVKRTRSGCTCKNYFFEIYPFVVGEALFVILIRLFSHSCEILIHPFVRNKIMDDIYEIFNGVPLSSFVREQQLLQIFPQGTVVPPPILPTFEQNSKITISTKPGKNSSHGFHKLPLERWLMEEIKINNHPIARLEKPGKSHISINKISPILSLHLTTSVLKQGQLVPHYTFSQYSTCDLFGDNILSETTSHDFDKEEEQLKRAIRKVLKDRFSNHKKKRKNLNVSCSNKKQNTTNEHNLM
ncbi:hypothetical protein RFI_02438 [Reticulomyxa filosa]|uniref:Uncharacterized protein n=1 Tax=Reticulomyxa filosa TaxID=46433 RepID=X6PAH8_RETFI|nr:hypothetical protein RFI_02438 [Reticulomyxa filosa]|eukprot:ETO34652.1 hypothetical protein RFI_02438 [Reticulomyxa filosa]